MVGAAPTPMILQPPTLIAIIVFIPDQIAICLIDYDCNDYNDDYDYDDVDESDDYDYDD